jgi:hypothetical protein
MLLRGRSAVSMVAAVTSLLCVSYGCPGRGPAPAGQPSTVATQPGSTVSSSVTQAGSTGDASRGLPVLSVEDTRPVAASFLQCDPAVLRLAPRQPEPRTHAWGTICEAAWLAPSSGPTARPGGIEVTVDRVSHYVTSALLRRGGSTDGAGRSSLPSPEAARRLAAAFIRERAGLPVQGPELKVRSLPSALSVRAEGTLPDGRRYSATLSFPDGEGPQYYTGYVLPVGPPPVPVRITADQACTLAREYASIVRKWSVTGEARIEETSTYNGAFAPPGVSVYLVRVTRIMDPTRPQMTVDEDVLVDSVTGKVIEEPLTVKSR